MLRFVGIFVCMVAFALPAYAVRIANCDGQRVYTVFVNNGGEVDEVVLEPMGPAYRTYGPMVEIWFEGQEPRYVRAGSEYCIFDGKLTIQRRSLDNKRRRAR